MAEESTSVQAGENGGQAQAADTQGQPPAEGQSAKPEGSNAAVGDEVPKRNAEHWEKQTERLKARQARAEFFKTKHAKSDDTEGESDEQPQYLTREEAERLTEERFQQFQSEIDSRSMKQSDDLALATFLGKPENERFRKYEATARKYMETHPYFPIEGIFRHLAYDDAQAEGAAKGVQADVAAKRHSTQGTSQRKEPQAPDFLKMSSKEFKEYERKQRETKRIPGDDD